MNPGPPRSSAAPPANVAHEMERAPRISVTWMGHSTVLVDVDGVRILTDPLLTRRLAHLRRRAPAPTVGPVDVVLISHVHMDHLHLPSLRKTASGARLIVPEGARRLVRRLPCRLDRGGSTRCDRPLPRPREREIGGRRRGCPRLSPPRSRSALAGRARTGRVRGAGRRAGCVLRGRHRSLRGHARAGPLDVALLPIWGWGRTLGERHLNPETAAVATSWLDPTTVVPIHWGTYSAVRFGRATRLVRSAADHIPRCARRPRAGGPSLRAATGRFVATRHGRRRQLTRATGPETSPWLSADAWRSPWRPAAPQPSSSPPAVARSPSR